MFKKFGGAIKNLPRAMKRINIQQLGPLLGLLVLIAIGLWTDFDGFGTVGNITNVLTRSAFIGIIAVGATFVITSGGLDLSVGSMTAFLAGMMIIIIDRLVPVMGAGWSTILLAMLAVMLMGFACGAINGLLVTAGRIEPFIVTLGMMGIFRSLITYLADGGALGLNRDVRAVYRPVFYGELLLLRIPYYGYELLVPYPVLVFLAVSIMGAVLLNKTRFGRYCSAIGSNEDVARYSAIKVNRIKLWTYVMQGGCVAIATLVYVPRLGSASGGTGLGWELEAITAVIIGGTLLKGGFGRIWGTIVGAIMLSLIRNILNLTPDISSHLNQFVQGVIIIVAVFLQRGRRNE